MSEPIDIKLPEVVANVWKALQDKYMLDDLEGPSPDSVFGRPARKWYTTAEIPKDLVSIDVYVLTSLSESIPGVEVVNWGDERKSYFYSGIKSIESGKYGEIPPDELEALLPGVPVRVVMKAMESEQETRTGIRRYKNNLEDIRWLVDSVSDRLEKMGVPRI